MEDTFLSGVKVQQVDYLSWRPYILPCDPLLWAGDTEVQKIVKWWQKPKDSTVGLSHGTLVFNLPIIGLKDKICGIEATGRRGLHPVQLSKKLMAEHGRCFHITTGLTDDQRIKGMQYAWDRTTEQIDYDYWDCIYNAFTRPIIDPSKYYCTEFLSDVWNHMLYTNLKLAAMPNDIVGIIRSIYPQLIITELIMPKEEAC